MANGVDTSKRRFLTASTAVVGAVGVGFSAVPFVVAWSPSAKAKALGAPIRIDVSKLEPGQRTTHLWQGKPVWVVRRTQESLETLKSLDPMLRDPSSEVDQQPGYARNEYRSIKPEVLVLVGLCTHLACSPTYVTAGSEGAPDPEWKGGFFCPCHGSRFDLAGRVFQGVPAPTNLVVPPYRYVNDTTIIVGEDQEAA